MSEPTIGEEIAAKYWSEENVDLLRGPIDDAQDALAELIDKRLAEAIERGE